VGAGGGDQAARVLCAMRVSLNTPELSAFRCLNPLCKPSFCDENHSAATKTRLVEDQGLSP
jgi:hypothetical protein